MSDDGATGATGDRVAAGHSGAGDHTGAGGDTEPRGEVTLRAATPDEADALMRLERETCLVALAHVFAPPFPDEDVRDRWRRVLENPQTHTVVALAGGASGGNVRSVRSKRAGGIGGADLVGYAATSGTELWHFGVHPQWYGSSLAPRLLDAACEVMSTAGPGPLRLWVLQDNHRARRFYAKHGWVASGERAASEFPPHPQQLRYQRG